MNSDSKKKLIGAILGVVIFAALIAGATYAWLTFNATVTNGVYNGTTKKFIINFTKGADINSVPQLATPTPETAQNLVVSAKLADDSIPGKITIKMTATSKDTLLTKSGAVHWAICSDTSTTSPCVNNFNNAKNQGVVDSSNLSNPITLWTDPTPLTADLKYYFVYFWIDPAKISNEMLEESGQSTFSGYVHASAEQVSQ